MSYADLQRKQFHWQQLFGLLDKLPIWAGYFFAILCSFGMGYSLGSARSSFPDPHQGQITLVALTAAALLLILFLDRTLRSEERRRAQRAEQVRLSKEAHAIELLDPVERHVLDALDQIASVKGVDRATLIPAILSQYIARKSFEEALRESAAQGTGGSSAKPEPPPGWFKTLPAWLETLPGSLDVKEDPRSSFPQPNRR
jgi:hypothetical protein